MSIAHPPVPADTPGGRKGLGCKHPQLTERPLAVAIRKLSTSASRLVDHHRLRGRSYPKPRYWEKLYQMLEEEAEKRGKTPPPPPLTFALDHEPTEQEKTDCLIKQIVWADRNMLLHRVQMYFDAMPSSCWNRVGDG